MVGRERARPRLMGMHGGQHRVAPALSPSAGSGTLSTFTNTQRSCPICNQGHARAFRPSVWLILPIEKTDWMSRWNQLNVLSCLVSLAVKKWMPLETLVIEIMGLSLPTRPIFFPQREYKDVWLVCISAVVKCFLYRRQTPPALDAAAFLTVVLSFSYWRILWGEPATLATRAARAGCPVSSVDRRRHHHLPLPPPPPSPFLLLLFSTFSGTRQDVGQPSIPHHLLVMARARATRSRLHRGGRWDDPVTGPTLP